VLDKEQLTHGEVIQIIDPEHLPRKTCSAAAAASSAAGAANPGRCAATHVHGRNSAMASATRNFHLPLPEDLYDELRSAAREAAQPATRFAQQLMRAGLEDWRRARRRLEVAVYARQIAGSTEDLDPELEHAGIRTLRAALDR